MCVRVRWGKKVDGPTNERTDGRTDKAFLGVGLAMNDQIFREKDERYDQLILNRFGVKKKAAAERNTLHERSPSQL